MTRLTLVRTLLLAAGVLGGAVVVLAVARPESAWWSNVPALDRFYTRWIPPSAPAAPEVLTSREREAFGRLAREASGRFIWSSNRQGNHELYSIDLGDLTVRRLTHHPNVDYFARVSPDGRWIAFVRSQRTWVSFREPEAWDLYVMAADGSRERRLAEEAVHPHWLADGSGVTFLRGNRVLGVDLQSGRERPIYDGSDAPTEGRLGDPVLGPDDLLCVALRRSKAPRGVGVVHLESGRYRALGGRSACQCTWMPGSRRALWVEAEGHGGTRIMHADAVNGEREVFMDLPGDYSHEYFPRVSSDGRWLVWGASAGGHEHDRADYEMFAWRIGSPWDSAIRLTFSEGNDQWPEFYNPD